VGLLSLIGLLGLLGWGTAPPQAQDLPQQPSSPSQASEPSRHVTRPGSYGHLSLSFEANQGQTDGQVQFLAHGQGYTLFLTAREAVFAFCPPAAPGPQPKGSAPRTGTGPDTPGTAQAVVRMQLLGANPAPQVVGLEELPGKANYFRGNDPQQWRTNVPTYGKVKYAVVYPGVDLVYYGQSRQLEYDFVVAPGVDPTVITLGFAGIDRVDVDAQGDLVLATPGGPLRFQKPAVYQERDGRRQAIAGGYVLKSPYQVGFQVAAYDTTKPLVIDPVLAYSTYLGGSSTDLGQGIAVDAAGHAYITGETSSTNFPTTSGALQTAPGGFRDAFVTKLNPAGAALVYSTYLGGSGTDVGRAIAVDGAGNAYVTGHTASPNFPTTPGASQTTLAGFRDAFVTKLNPAGSALVYSTYLGGSNSDEGVGIAVDSTGSAYVTGDTVSPNFPTTPGAFQTTLGRPFASNAFVTKLNPAGSALVYSTYLGGTGGDSGLGIAVDSTGNAYVTGETSSPNFPTTPGALQATLGASFATNAFVTKLNPAGSDLVYSTYLGGNDFDRGLGIAVDSTGHAYVTGETSSPNFPTTSGALQTTLGRFADAFVTQLDPTGSNLLFSTYLGGNGVDVANGIAVDAAGNTYITGSTHSPNFPTTPSAFQTTLGGLADAFVTQLDPTGSNLVFSTYLGGSSNDFGQGIAVDAAGAAYVAGFTSSPNFPTAHPLQPTLNGRQNAFVAKIAEAPTNRCPQGQGFWKNHPGLWPVTSLTLGRQSYTQAALLALFDTPPRGDASLILAYQLITAKLNLANGSDPTPIRATITDADSLLSQFGATNRLPYNVQTSSAIGQQMVNDANVLDRYNNGDLTPDCQP